MQASSYSSVKGGFGIQNQRKGLLGFGELRNRTSSRSRSLCMADRRSCCGGLSLSSVAKGVELARARMGVDGIFGSSARPRSVKAQASGLFILFDYFLFVTSLIGILVSSLYPIR